MTLYRICMHDDSIAHLGLDGWVDHNSTPKELLPPKLPIQLEELGRDADYRYLVTEEP